MSEPAALFIAACWGAWLLYWVLTAFSAKRTVERGSFFGYRLVTGAGVLVVVIAGRLLHDSSATQLWRSSLPVALLSDLIVLAGAAVMVWARLTLGRNWSAEVSLKQDHELIESGPYAHVRHPIYSGLLLMCLGTAIFYGRALGFGLLLALAAGLWWKARGEEQMMSRHFPDAYADYSSRVHAIIPHVL